MKKNMTKMLLLATMLMASSSMWAYDFIVDGLRYSKKSANEVWVAKYSEYASSVNYEGDIVVLDEVVYEGVTYKVTGVSQWAFGNNSRITSVTLGNNVKTLDEKSFYQSRNMKKVVLGKSVEKIMAYAFDSCDKLTGMQLPESLVEIGECAFSATSITWIAIPDKVTTVGRAAFMSCSELASATIGKGLTTIGDEMFASCSALKSITVPDHEKTIGNKAFSKAGVETVYIGKGVTSIEKLAFAACKNLKTVYAAPAKPATLGTNVFYQLDLSKISLVVPTGSKSAYQSADVWKEFGKISEMDNIETANIQQATEQVTLKGIYDINGRQLPAMQKGLNVVKMSNGETRKVVVK